jgi:hypothetical protein
MGCWVEFVQVELLQVELLQEVELLQRHFVAVASWRHRYR